MTNVKPTHATRVVCAATLFLAAVLPAAAIAGECPPTDVLATPKVLEEHAGAMVEDTVLETIRLEDWRGADGLMLRTRRLVIGPGGVVPNHSHADRPAIITVVSGEIVEHRSSCGVPIVHKAGESTAEFGADLDHWWENTSGAPVVVLSSDIVPAENADESMM